VCFTQLTGNFSLLQLVRSDLLKSLAQNVSNCYSILCRGVEDCDEHVCLYIGLAVCLWAYLRNGLSKFHQNFCACSIFLWRHCDTISGFVDDAMFSYNGPIGSMMKLQQPHCNVVYGLNPCCVLSCCPSRLQAPRLDESCILGVLWWSLQCTIALFLFLFLFNRAKYSIVCGLHPSVHNLMLLVGEEGGIRPAKYWVVGCWCGYMSGSMCIFACGPAVCHCHSLSLAPVNPDWFYLPGFTFLVPAHPGSPGQNSRGP